MSQPIAVRGQRHPVVPALKRRLGFAVCDDLYDEQLEMRVRGLQLINRMGCINGQLTQDVLDYAGVSNDP